MITCQCADCCCTPELNIKISFTSPFISGEKEHPVFLTVVNVAFRLQEWLRKNPIWRSLWRLWVFFNGFWAFSSWVRSHFHFPSLTCKDGVSLTMQSVYSRLPPWAPANPRHLFLIPPCALLCCPWPAGVGCIVLMVYLMFTSLWPVSTLYFMWLVKDWRTPERGTWKYHWEPCNHGTISVRITVPLKCS